MLLRAKETPDELPLRAMLHILIAMLLAGRYFSSKLSSPVNTRASQRRWFRWGGLSSRLDSFWSLLPQGLICFVRPSSKRSHWRPLIWEESKSTCNPPRLRRRNVARAARARAGTLGAELTVGKALVDSHCNRCHALDLTYQSAKSPTEWKETVLRMVKYARGTEGFFKSGEDERIVEFLSTTQTPEAAQKRLSATPDLVRDSEHSANRVEPIERAQGVSSLPMVGVTAILAAVFVPLMWRRPKSPSQKAAGVSVASPAFVPNNSRSVILQLVRTESKRMTVSACGFVLRKPVRSGKTGTIPHI